MLDPSEEELSFGWECLRDISASTVDRLVLRNDIRSELEASEWVKCYSAATNTSWNVSKTAGQGKCKRMVCHKVWRCYCRNRTRASSNLTTKCMAMIDIKIKKVNRNTQKNDPFLRHCPPLCAVIKLSPHHNHDTESADALRLLRCAKETKELFYGYFHDGLTPCDAMHLHESSLSVEGDAGSLLKLASSAYNPTSRAVYHMYDTWRENCSGAPCDPLTRLQEKIPQYAQLGVGVKVRPGGAGRWAVLMVTPIMRRAQLLESSSEVIFVDTTTSCGSTKNSVTVMSTATEAGAVPIAFIVHGGQTTESYSAGFELLKESYPFCFGGCEAPDTFMTDDCADEKAALLKNWPDSRQLLYHFRMAQGVWRWMTRHGISPSERTQLMAIFRKVMYAENRLTLAEARADLHHQQRKGFTAHVEALLERAEEWELAQNPIERMIEAFDRFEVIMGNDPRYPMYQRQMAKFTKCLASVTSKEGVMKIMKCMLAAVSMTLKRQGKTCVKSTSISRRRLGLNNGSKSGSPGRPLKKAERSLRVCPSVKDVPSVK